MDNSNVIAIDAGNTSIKIGVFHDGKLLEVNRISINELEPYLNKNKGICFNPCVVSSVVENELTNTLSHHFDHLLVIDHQSKLPFKSDYETFQTLGIDRICNVAALSKLSPGTNVVSVDIGTCIKFDFLKENGHYAGGSISPGLHLRYKSLNDYTANLPLLQNTKKTPLVGNSTKSSIHSGVYNGMMNEILGMIHSYEQQFGDLTFFVTGGDAVYFDLAGKNNIFADENLTLKGLYYLYTLNA